MSELLKPYSIYSEQTGLEEGASTFYCLEQFLTKKCSGK
jgi:hypothetical protein